MIVIISLQSTQGSYIFTHLDVSQTMKELDFIPYVLRYLLFRIRGNNTLLSKFHTQLYLKGEAVYI